MKLVMTLFVSLFATAAMAKTPDVNTKALEVFFKNSAKMKTVYGQSAAALLAEFVVNGKGTHNKSTNECTLDSTKKTYNCVFGILNSDDSGQTESSMRFSYELNQGDDGMPSEKVTNLTFAFDLFG